MSLPEVRLTRERIESCKVKKYQMFLKAEYLFGARAIEVAGKLCSCDILRGKLKEPYGPKGINCWLSETEPPDMKQKAVAMILLKAIGGNHEEAIATVDALTRNVPVAVFKINIAKQHPEQGEEYPFRLVALPLVDDYEPWASEMFEYFKVAGDNYVFPFNRQEVWEYITRKQRIFEGLTYRIKKYNYPGEVEDETKTSFSHPRKLKNHGLRHIRTNELLTDYGFDGIDLGAMIGWSMNSTQKISASPSQAGNYAEIREAWKRYIKKLCKPNPYSFHSSKEIGEN